MCQRPNGRPPGLPARSKKISMMSTDSDFEGVVHNTVTTLVPELMPPDEDDDVYSNQRLQISTKVWLHVFKQ